MDKTLLINTCMDHDGSASIAENLNLAMPVTTTQRIKVHCKEIGDIRIVTQVPL
jgi:hypothetical protein